MFLLPNLVAWLAHLKVAFSYYSSIISIVTPVRAQASLKDMQRQYGKARALGMFGYCVL